MDSQLKQIGTILSVIALAFFFSSSAAGTESATQSYSQTVLLKNWVLSRCLAKATPSKPAKDDAQLTASAYLEFGNLPIEAYDEGESLVDQYLKRHYSGVINGNYNTMKCIDLFHGKELDALARKYADAPISPSHKF
jgi:hypothetical protein